MPPTSARTAASKRRSKSQLLLYWWLTGWPSTTRVGSEASRSLAITTSSAPTSAATATAIDMTIAVIGMCPLSAPRALSASSVGSIVRRTRTTGWNRSSSSVPSGSPLVSMPSTIGRRPDTDRRCRGRRASPCRRRPGRRPCPRASRSARSSRRPRGSDPTSTCDAAGAIAEPGDGAHLGQAVVDEGRRQPPDRRRRPASSARAPPAAARP